MNDETEIGFLIVAIGMACENICNAINGYPNRTYDLEDFRKLAEQTGEIKKENK